MIKIDSRLPCEQRLHFRRMSWRAKSSLVGRGYFSHASSYRENVASARRVTAVICSQDKRSHNRLLSGEIEQAGVKLSCACNTGVKMTQNLLTQLRKSVFLV